jgi:gluconolactonase
MRTVVEILLVVTSLSNPTEVQRAKPSGEAIVPADAELELLFTRRAPIAGGLTEGPAAAPDGRIYFTDIPVGKDRGMILAFDPASGETAVFTDDSGKANGLMVDLEGRLVACEGADDGGRQVSRWDLKTRARTTLADRFRGKRFNAPNDLAIDLMGRIYFTDPRYLGDEDRELAARAVYRIEAGGEVIEVTREVEKPNGIILSPDQRTLYVVDHNNGTDRIDPQAPPPAKGAMAIYAFPLGPDGLVEGPRRTLIDFGSEDGCDGMTVDTLGNLYLTARSLQRPGVLVVDAQGKELAFIPTGPPQPGAKEPAGLPSNCVFGLGDEANRLYVTVDKSLYRIRLKTRGIHAFEHAALKAFRDQLVSIRPGRDGFPAVFSMGRDGASAAEAPAHRVALEHDFAIARYEVTQNLWGAVMGRNPSRWPGPRNSVENLSFDEAMEFCRRATSRLRELSLIRADEAIRLPTEAEWEYCARAGAPTLYSFGDDAAKLGDHGWFNGNAKGNDPPVGAKAPNPWGLYDVHGYLWEWCLDPWHPDYRGAPAGAAAWTDGGEAAVRVLRGGSWKDPAEALTSSARRPGPAASRDDAVGLRCVLAGAASSGR